MALNSQCDIKENNESNDKTISHEETEIAQQSQLQNQGSCSSSEVLLDSLSSTSNLENKNCYSQITPNSEVLKSSPSDDVKKSDLECNYTLKEATSPSCQSSKRKLQNVKHRSGVLYKQLKSSKTAAINSKYFNQAHNTQKKWVPPRSPYCLVQEDLFDKPWQLLIATIFLTKTAAKRALPQLHKFLAQYPRPEDLLQAKNEDIDEYFKPLGLTATRSHAVIKFTVEYLEKDWTYPRELYGIGKYGDDSYRMFCINEWQLVSPDDIPLTKYRNWLLENADRLGIK